MLKLVFNVEAKILKVRHASSEDNFENSSHWKNKIQFILTTQNDFMMTWTSLLPDLDPSSAHAFVELVGARYPLSPLYEELKKINTNFLFKNGSEEWIFYGGSFNPWHQGHQSCLNLLPMDKVCLVVPDRNPFKEIKEINPVTTVLEISSNAKFNRNQFLVPSFLFLRKPNPTVNWIERLKEDFPTHKLSLLMGFDSFSNIKSWTRANDLLPLLDTIYVVSRLEDDQDRFLALDEAHALSRDLNVVFLGKHEFEDISSTEIRLNQN